MVMKRAASNGHGQNVSGITALHAVSHFSEAPKPAEHARNQSLTNWMDLCEGKSRELWKLGFHLTHFVKFREDFLKSLLTGSTKTCRFQLIIIGIERPACICKFAKKEI